MKNRILNIDIPLLQLTVRTVVAGKLSFKGVFILLTYYIKMIAALPLNFLQFCFFSRKISETMITKTPVFILGHYRSGTTYLQKMMCSDPRTGVISNYDMICPNSSLLLGGGLKQLLQFTINTFKIKTPFFNNLIPQLDEPAEEERFLISKGSAFSSYWGFVFPKHWREWLNEEDQFGNPAYIEKWKTEYIKLIKQFSFKNRGKQLILKNPPNSCRIKQLLSIFPDAKFIYIYRNPYHLFYSMKNMWMKAIMNYSLQKISEPEIEEIIFGHYDYFITKYESQKQLIPAGNLIEIKYEDLEKDPFSVTENIYTRLNLEGFDRVSEKIREQVQYEKSYTKFTYNYDEDTFRKIEKYWSTHIQNWEYDNQSAVSSYN